MTQNGNGGETKNRYITNFIFILVSALAFGYLSFSLRDDYLLLIFFSFFFYLSLMSSIMAGILALASPKEGIHSYLLYYTRLTRKFGLRSIIIACLSMVLSFFLLREFRETPVPLILLPIPIAAGIFMIMSVINNVKAYLVFSERNMGKAIALIIAIALFVAIITAFFLGMRPY